MGKRMRLGGGGRFDRLVAELRSKGRASGIKNPAALAASIGRRKYGKRKFQKLAAIGRRRIKGRAKGTMMMMEKC